MYHKMMIDVNSWLTHSAPIDVEELQQVSDKTLMSEYSRLVDRYEALSKCCSPEGLQTLAKREMERMNAEKEEYNPTSSRINLQTAKAITLVELHQLKTGLDYYIDMFTQQIYLRQIDEEPYLEDMTPSQRVGYCQQETELEYWERKLDRAS